MIARRRGRRKRRP